MPSVRLQVGKAGPCFVDVSAHGPVVTRLLVVGLSLHDYTIVVGCHQWWSADKDPGVVIAVSREDPNSRTSTWSLVEDYTLPVEVKKGLIPWLVAIKSGGSKIF